MAGTKNGSIFTAAKQTEKKSKIIFVNKSLKFKQKPKLSGTKLPAPLETLQRALGML